MIEVKIKTEYITLGQLLKYKGIINLGGEVKAFLNSHKIYVNDLEENRRGKKLYKNDTISILDKIYKIII